MYEKHRTQKLRELMMDKNLDAVIISNFENQYYFSGLKAITYSRPILLIVEKNKESLILPTLEENHARHKTEVGFLYAYHEVQGKDGATSYLEQVRAMLENLPEKITIGIEYNSLPSQISLMIEEGGFKFENIESEITRMRSIKSEREIEMITESGKLVSKALQYSVENAKAGITELEMDYFGNEYLFKEI